MSFSPVLFPEKRDSFVGNIVRAVASINLETIEAAYHSVRYKVDYHMIHARLKYYSNSKNPRVIHTKLQNQKLVTLRTNPHDPYLVKPGEFLTLGSAGEYNAETLDGLLHYYYHPGSLDIESCPPTFCENVKGDELVDVEYSKGKPVKVKEPQAHQSQIARLQKWDEPMVSESSTAGPGKKKIKRILQKRAQAPVKEHSSGAGLDSPLDSLLPRYLQSSYSSPVTFAPESADARKRLGFGKSATSGKDSGSPLDNDSVCGQYAQYSNFLQVISPVDSVSIFRQNSPRQRGPQNYREARNDERKVWQVVLSDISLSAARLSTGSEGTSREDFESLKGDLTHAKVREPDYFAENMRQGKAKFHGNSPDGPKRTS